MKFSEQEKNYKKAMSLLQPILATLDALGYRIELHRKNDIALRIVRK